MGNLLFLLNPIDAQNSGNNCVPYLKSSTNIDNFLWKIQGGYMIFSQFWPKWGKLVALSRTSFCPFGQDKTDLSRTQYRRQKLAQVRTSIPKTEKYSPIRFLKIGNISCKLWNSGFKKQAKPALLHVLHNAHCDTIPHSQEYPKLCYRQPIANEENLIAFTGNTRIHERIGWLVNIFSGHPDRFGLNFPRRVKLRVGWPGLSWPFMLSEFSEFNR